MICHLLYFIVVLVVLEGLVKRQHRVRSDHSWNIAVSLAQRSILTSIWFFQLIPPGIFVSILELKIRVMPPIQLHKRLDSINICRWEQDIFTATHFLFLDQFVVVVLLDDFHIGDEWGRFRRDQFWRGQVDSRRRLMALNPALSCHYVGFWVCIILPACVLIILVMPVRHRTMIWIVCMAW